MKNLYHPTPQHNPDQGKGLAIASLIFGIVSVILLSPAMGIPGLILGITGLLYLSNHSNFDTIWRPIKQK